MSSIHHLKSDLAPSQVASHTSSKMLVISATIGIALVIIGILGLSRTISSFSFSTIEGVSLISCGGALLLTMPLLLAAKEKGNKAFKVEKLKEKQEEIYLHPSSALKSLKLRMITTGIFLSISIALITIGALGLSHVLMMKTFVAALHLGVGLFCSVWMIKHLVDLKEHYGDIQVRDQILQKQLEAQASRGHLRQYLQNTAVQVGLRVATSGTAWGIAKLLGA